MAGSTALASAPNLAGLVMWLCHSLDYYTGHSVAIKSHQHSRRSTAIVQVPIARFGVSFLRAWPNGLTFRAKKRQKYKKPKFENWCLPMPCHAMALQMQLAWKSSGNCNGLLVGTAEPWTWKRWQVFLLSARPGHVFGEATSFYNNSSTKKERVVMQKPALVASSSLRVDG